MSGPLLQAAHGYVDRGWFVFPIQPGGKEPLVMWRDESCIDHEQVDAWWGRWPDANIGIDCGTSGLLVVDIDDYDVLDEAADLLGWRLEDADTLVAETGSGGLHIVYTVGPDSDLGNSRGALPRGIDVRGDGGYIVAAPSLHPSGRFYSWFVRKPPSPVPDSLADVLRATRRTYEPVEAPAMPVAEGRGQQWAQSILAGEVETVRSAPPGAGNEALFEAALRAFGPAKAGYIDGDLVRETLVAAACLGGRRPFHEAHKTVGSAAERADARHPPERERPERPPVPTMPTAAPVDGTQQTYDLLDLDGLRGLPPPRWLLPQVMPDGVTMLAGHRGAGKSFVALDMAATVARTTGEPVLYFAGEGVSGFARRVEAWASEHGGIGSLRVVSQVPRLLDPTHVEMLYATVRDARPAAIVIDTFSRAIVGGDENNHTEVSPAVESLTQLHTSYGCSTLLVHHLNANGERPRGHTSLEGGVDAIWKVASDADNPDRINMQNVKMKDDREQPPRLTQLRDVPEVGSAVVYPSLLGGL